MLQPEPPQALGVVCASLAARLQQHAAVALLPDAQLDGQRCRRRGGVVRDDRAQRVAPDRGVGPAQPGAAAEHHRQEAGGDRLVVVVPTARPAAQPSALACAR